MPGDMRNVKPSRWQAVRRLRASRVSVHILGDSEREVRALFDALRDGGLKPCFWPMPNPAHRFDKSRKAWMAAVVGDHDDQSPLPEV